MAQFIPEIYNKNYYKNSRVFLGRYNKALGFVDVVKEFYANMVGMKDKTIYVIGKGISFSREEIEKTYNLNERKHGSKFKKLVKELDF